MDNWDEISWYHDSNFKKNSGCYYENLAPIHDDAVLLDLVFPGGIPVNTACVYGHKDDETFWDLVKSNLDLRNSEGGKMILGDFNVSLNFTKDTYNYLTDPHHTARKKINQWL